MQDVLTTNELAWIGLATILVTLAAIMSGRVSALVALILVPVVAALGAGFGGGVTGMITDGVRQIAPVMGMFVFAILYFGIITDTGFLTPIVDGIVRLVDRDPRRVVVGSTVIAMVSHLGGSGAVSFLITVTAMLPLYDRLGIDRRVLACSAAMGAGVNVLPWSGVTLRASAALDVPTMEIFRPLIIPELAGIAFVLGVSWWLGARAARGQLATAPAEGGTDGAESMQPEVAAPVRPGLFWINLALTLAIFASLIAGLTAPMIVFMIGLVLLLLVNYPAMQDQRRRINAHASEALTMASLLFAAGAFSGILSGTGMITALAEAGTSLLPQSVGTHLAFIIALISMPLSLLVDASSFYFGVLPVLAGIGENFGLEKAQIAQAALLGQMTTGFPVSPLTPAPFLLVGLLKLDLGSHQRFSFVYLFATTLVMTAVAVIAGVFPP